MDEFFEYLYVTGQLDSFFGEKKEDNDTKEDEDTDDDNYVKIRKRIK